MTSGTAIRAGRAFVELFADSAALTRGLRDAEAKLRAFGKTVQTLGRHIAAVGAAAVAPMTAAARAFADYGDQFAKMAARTGLSVEALSELAYAAQISGADIQTVEAAVRRMHKTLADAAAGSADAQTALAMLGMTYQHLARVSPQQQFVTLGQQLSELRSAALKSALAMQLFGRSGTQLLPMFQQGAAGLDALRRQAKSFGLTIDQRAADAAVKLNDALFDLKSAARGAWLTLGAALAPTLTELAKRVSELIARFNRWLAANKQIIVSAAKAAAGLIAVGAAMMAFGAAVSAVGALLGKLAATVALVATGLKTTATSAALLTRPFIALAALAAAFAGYLLYASGAGGAALAWLAGQFNTLKSDAQAAIAGIADALAAGQIGLAARILWLTLKMEWLRGVSALAAAWQKAWVGLLTLFDEFKTAVVVGWHDLQKRIALLAADFIPAAVSVSETLSAAWTELIETQTELWGRLFSYILDGLDKIKEYLGGIVDYLLRVAAKLGQYGSGIRPESQPFILLKGAALVSRQMQRTAQGLLDLTAQPGSGAELRKQLTERWNETMADLQRRKQAKRLQSQQLSEQIKQQIVQDADQRQQQAVQGMMQRQANISQSMQAGANQAERELADAISAWREAIQQAQEARQKSHAAEPAGKPSPFRLPSLPDIGALFEQIEAKLSAAGAFSGFERFGQAGDTAAQRTANAAEKISKDVSALLALQQDQADEFV